MNAAASHRPASRLATSARRADALASRFGVAWLGAAPRRSAIAVARRVAAPALLASALGATGAEALVAAAANFAHPLARIEAAFEEGAHGIDTVVGATGKLYAQIVHGAPFDVFLAADRERPRRLEAAGFAVADSRRNYALGRMALWSATRHRSGAAMAQRLREGGFKHLAIANPQLAPYGVAALQTLRAMRLFDAYAGRLAMGENVGQALALVATGAAELGFVALSDVMRAGADGSHWQVPAHLHEPIWQDAVLLRRGADNPAARAFLAFLASDRARRIIVAAGYDAPPPAAALAPMRQD